MTDIVEPESNRFKVALSFPGEHRDFVLKVAEELATRLTRDRVFYDEWYEIELLGVGGDLKLQSMYEQADLVVPFFSEYYSKSWCSLEWETIRGILLNRRKEDAVIPVHLDDTVIPGWSTVNFGIRLKGRTPQKISEIILKILAQRNLLNVSQQERIKELTKKLEEIERSHQSQIAKKESEIIRLQNTAKSQQEKNEELTKKLEEIERSQIQKLGEIERSHQQQLEKIKAASSQERKELEQNYQRQKQELEQERSPFIKQQADLQAAQEKIAEKEAIIAQLQEQLKKEGIKDAKSIERQKEKQIERLVQDLDNLQKRLKKYNLEWIINECKWEV